MLGEKSASLCVNSDGECGSHSGTSTNNLVSTNSCAGNKAGSGGGK